MTVTSYYVELRYYVRDAGRDVLDEHGDAMMDALLVEPNLIDPDIGVNFTTGAVDVTANVHADDEPAALRLALIAIRSAAHHAGAGTAHGWDEQLSEISSHVRPAEMVEQ